MHQRLPRVLTERQVGYLVCVAVEHTDDLSGDNVNHLEISQRSFKAKLAL